MIFELGLNHHSWAGTGRECKVQLSDGKQTMSISLQVLLQIVCGELVKLLIQTPNVGLQQTCRCMQASKCYHVG